MSNKSELSTKVRTKKYLYLLSVLGSQFTCVGSILLCVDDCVCPPLPKKTIFNPGKTLYSACSTRCLVY